jgi:mono/diheme cytochrome c family protein
LRLTTIRLAVLVSYGSVLLLGFQRLSSDEARKLKNPVPFTKKSIAHGRTIFAQSCSPCHGPDGKSQVDVIGNATDLTSPKDYKSGTSDGEIFRSIRDGAGDSMPSFKSQLAGDAEMWDMVNFIHSLWPESMRPPLVEDKSKEHDR